MKIECVEGIILTETNYSESSKILNVLTKEYGLIGIMSKGSRNLKSKLRGVSRKLIYGKFNIYYKETGLSTLISVDVINSYSNILSDLERLSYASFILELAYQVVKQTEDMEVFDLVINVLSKIEEGFNPNILTVILQLQMLNFLGVAPSLDSCSICGSTKRIITIDSHSGGFICRNCYKSGKIVSEETIKLIRMFYYVDVCNIKKMDIDEDKVTDINEFLDDYYDRYTGLFLKSKSFIKDVRRVESV